MLDKSIEIIKGIGTKRKESLNAIGIYTIRDLLYHFPYAYKDIEKKEYFRDKNVGDEIAAKVTVITEAGLFRLKNKFSIVSFSVTDGYSDMKCVYFNQPYMKKNISIGDEFIIVGTIEQKNKTKQINNPKIIQLDDKRNVITSYRLPKAINQKSFIKSIEYALKALNNQITEPLCDGLRKKYKLVEINYAIEQVHFPTSISNVDSAAYRLAFEEMLFFIVILRQLKKSNAMHKGIRLEISDDCMDRFISSLPFRLTSAQERVLKQIRDNISDEEGPAMNRLLQGDVGSGKTVIAIAALYISVKSGHQGVMMAPTEILAMQHYGDLKEALEPLDIIVRILTSSMKIKEKREILSDLKEGEIDVLVGTHAVIQEKVEFNNLGMAITDEQHRFGVNQRALLHKKGNNPHTLVMSATPVPRTLALILYGDLDISVIDELPPGRKIIKTRIVSNKKKDAMYDYIAKRIQDGEQAYIVCPLIEESEKLDAKSANELYQELKVGAFCNIEIGLLHGRMKDSVKNEMLKRFDRGEIKALVSTTVIEVGVNVKAATIMVVENAERFGLAQLHQLRGRVGRSDRQSWCFLTTKNVSETSAKRLEIMMATNDGFLIAQKDLEMRGPGQFIGLRQSGLLDRRVIALMNNSKLISQIQEAVNSLQNGEFGDVYDDITAQAHKRYKAKLEDIILN